MWIALTGHGGHRRYVNMDHVIWFGPNPHGHGSQIEMMHGPYWQHGGGFLAVEQTPDEIHQLMGAP